MIELMKTKFSAQVRSLLAGAFLIGAALGMAGCQTVAPDNGIDYDTPQLSTPIERATYMQDRLGQITRRNIR